ncbi:MAG: flagellar basal body-associated FliL family protein [Leptospiraceae bacterium]|nr:flagellar basal body-associated FliL family protein [Leptospiraceae bacterium]MCP5513110.1 flagellar basal body-associated FliL family protein [Leptospiraceae bacterium]
MGDGAAEIEEDEGGAPSAEPKKSSPLVKWLMYAAGGILLVIIVAVVSTFVAQKTANSVYKQQKNIALVKAPPPLDVFNFSDEFRINTSDVGEAHFIKLKLSFGVEKGQPALTQELAERLPQMQNIINLIISRKNKEELKSIKDQLDLREEIKAHINHILTNGKIKEVYFREFIVN